MSRTDSGPIYPETNRKASDLLYILETGLRELIIETLESHFGTHWYKSRLPPDVLQKYLRGIVSERSSHWIEHVAHHPLYYIDFPDLHKVIVRNWDDAFSRMFSDKSVLHGLLRSIEPLRNRLAHNRLVTETDVTILHGVVTQLEHAVGTNRLHLLAQRCTRALGIVKSLQSLIPAIDNAEATMLSLGAPADPAHWSATSSQWWFDSEYLSGQVLDSNLAIAEQRVNDLSEELSRAETRLANVRLAMSKSEAARIDHLSEHDHLESLRHSFELYRHYCGLPRSRGTGHTLEQWCNAHDIVGIASRARSSLHFLCEGQRDVDR